MKKKKKKQLLNWYITLVGSSSADLTAFTLIALILSFQKHIKCPCRSMQRGLLWVMGGYRGADTHASQTLTCPANLNITKADCLLHLSESKIVNAILKPHYK